MPHLPVVVLTGLTRPEQDLAALTLAWALPRPVVVRHDLDLEAGTLRRVVSDESGLVEEAWVPLDHTCLSCALRHEIVPTLVRLAGERRWESVLLDLPEAVDPVPVVRALGSMVVGGRPARDVLDIRSVVAAVTGESLLGDVFGDDLMAERTGPESDRRAVGEVRCRQVEYADLVVCVDHTLPTEAAALLGELVRPGTWVLEDPTCLDVSRLLAPRDHRAADSHVEPDARVPAGTHTPGEVVDASMPLSGEIWTVYVDTWRPFHPGRLMEQLEAIGGGRVRSRGCFWLPTRPGAMNLWEGAGGCLAVGPGGAWGDRRPRTRLVITGRGGRRTSVMDAVSAALMTDAELARGLARWAGREDGFDPWLGEQSEAA